MTIDSILQQMTTAARQEQWQTLSALDRDLRKCLEQAMETAQNKDYGQQKKLLQDISQAQNHYRELVQLCNQNQTQLNQQNQALKRGHKAASYYLKSST